MGKKIVIGLIGEEDQRKKIASIFSDIGFYKASVTQKTEELAKYLLPGNVFPSETLQEIRLRGYRVSKCYWINLVLASVPDSKDLIVIEDLQKEDIIKGVIIPYVCAKDSNIEGVDSINPDSKNLEAEIHGKIKKIAAR